MPSIEAVSDCNSGLVWNTHTSFYQGDAVVVLPKFEMDTCLNAIQRFKLNILYIVSHILLNVQGSVSTGVPLPMFFPLTTSFYSRSHQYSFSSPAMLQHYPATTSPPSAQSSPVPLPLALRRLKTCNECSHTGLSAKHTA